MTHSRLRVGIVLPQDEVRCLEMILPEGQCTINGTPRTGAFAAHLDGATIELRGSVDCAGRRDCWTIAPVVEDESHGVTIRDCRIGRGFHWSSKVDLFLPGRVELSVAGGYLLVVNDLPAETYLKGVITAEMSGECPMAFLKAQTIVARSWMRAAAERKHADLNIDYCNDDCCQRYQGVSALTDSARAAVNETAGDVLVHASGAIVDANYSKSCGGIVESPEAVWGHRKVGQKSAVDAPPASEMERFFPVTRDNVREYVAGSWLERCDAYCGPRAVAEGDLGRYLGRVDDGGGHFRWRVTCAVEELEDLLRRKHFNRGEDGGNGKFHRLWDLAVVRRGRSGRATRLVIDYDDPQGKRATATVEDQYDIRNCLHESFLYSSAFDVCIKRDDSNRPVRVDLLGAGWGHGAGMCQIGALGMALAGSDHKQILHHYFEDVTIRHSGVNDA